jgi:hypothetical protein
MYTLDSESRYVNFHATAKSIFTNWVENNPNYKFDFFIHSWSIDLASQLVDLYKPKVALFEQNYNYKDDFQAVLDKSGLIGDKSAISQYFSLKKGIELVESYVDQTDILYDLIISCRLDILLYKKVHANFYNENMFYINRFNEQDDLSLDIHFTTGYKNRHLLKNIYDNIGRDCLPKHHEIIFNYFKKINKLELLRLDEIVYHRDIALLRVLLEEYKFYRITKEQLESFGLTVEEIHSYCP